MKRRLIIVGGENDTDSCIETINKCRFRLFKCAHPRCSYSPGSGVSQSGNPFKYCCMKCRDAAWNENEDYVHGTRCEHNPMAYIADFEDPGCR